MRPFKPIKWVWLAVIPIGHWHKSSLLNPIGRDRRAGEQTLDQRTPRLGAIQKQLVRLAPKSLGHQFKPVNGHAGFLVDDARNVRLRKTRPLSKLRLSLEISGHPKLDVLGNDFAEFFHAGMVPQSGIHMGIDRNIRIWIMADMNKPMYTAVIETLNSRKGEWRLISEGSDVPYSTLCKIAQGHIESPSVHVVQKLYDYLLGDAEKSRTAA